MSLEIAKPAHPETKTLNVLSLFSGCGGMDLGFEGGFTVHNDSINETLSPNFIATKTDNSLVLLKPTRFRTVFANDILPEARNAWNGYFRERGRFENIYHLESIVDLVKRHKQGEAIFPENIDVVTGGFPCQDFSLAGKRKGFDSHKDHNGRLIGLSEATTETRGQLYMWLKEVVEITRPKIFIAENVKGLTNLSNVKEIIQNDFASINGNGYLVLPPRVLHAADYGVPQNRERVIFIGISKEALKPEALKALSSQKIADSFNPYPAPTHSFTAKGEKLKKPVNLSTIFKGLEEPEKSADPSQQFYSKARFMGRHCQGQKEIDLNGIGPTIRAEHHGNIEYRRLSAANGGTITGELEKGLPERRLTPRECGLIQTFPTDYNFVTPSGRGRFTVSPSAAYKIIGNAVPPLLAYNIAKRLESLWEVYFGILKK
jgi:DNA (cytosine-5)-methyltransferase 1